VGLEADPAAHQGDRGANGKSDLGGHFVGRSDDGTHMPHHRCHRAKATHKYIVASRTGIEYVDLKAEHWDRNDWVRGACLYGVVPANGLTYAPPHSCACYIIAKLNGLTALAARRGAESLSVEAPHSRLVMGRAPESPIPQSQVRNWQLGDWPTYRGDTARSGYNAAAVPAALRRAWKATIGGRLSSPVIVGGKLYVAAVDDHTVHALDAASGEAVWTFTAGGRVDSPPTFRLGRVLFGSADGHIYCLRAADGALVWRFRAAPRDLRLTAWEQVESVWPVHGSVLVIDGVVHAVAGRSMFLDGGLRYVRLEAATGELLSENVMGRHNPDTGKHPEFQHLSEVKVSPSKLGWHLKTPSGRVGLALRRLPAPLTRAATLKVRVLMHPNPARDPSKPPPGNAFLAFGDGTGDEVLIKCGLRSAGQSASIVEGPLLKGKVASQRIVCKVKEPMDLEVSFDPAAQKVRLRLLGEVVETTLERRLDRVTHIGYAVHSVASEFGPVSIVSP